MTRLIVARVGRVERRDAVPGVAVLDAAGVPVVVIDAFLATLEASDSTATTLYSYATALLRWWRFLTAVGVEWDRASRVEVRDYVLWLRFTPKAASGRARIAGSGYAPATINHNLAVLRSFYDERLDAGDGPVVNPVPSAKTRDGERRHAHHNPMQRFVSQRRAPLRQKTPVTVSRGLSGAAFDDLFEAMGNDRDRALLAFYVSTGARASELLGLSVDRVDPGEQMVGVFRKGTGRLQWLPASGDAFVWWRLYEARLDRPVGMTEVWLTRRGPPRPLTYAAMRRVIQRANDRLETGWTLHDLRHTAAQRMITDPGVSLPDVQWVLGHRHLSTTEIYVRPGDDEVIARVRRHHADRAVGVVAAPSAGYRPDVLATLLGRQTRG